ncbi:MAG: hypothetical protein JXO51_01315 [Candidatus Aminicenantes bacterium]|nr:hypothetical protein [Candidatus Aminicenantes bacterium]
MIKKNKKILAGLVVLAFLSLLRVSAMPLRAVPAPDRAEASLESPDQAPGFIEEEADTVYRPKKKSALPLILGVVAVGAVAAVLVLVVFKTKYDILGTWKFSFTSTAPAHSWTWTLTFRGDKKNGTFIDDYDDTGTYRVDNKDVSLEYDEWDISMTGKFDGKDTMSGTATFSGLTIGQKEVTSASWTATRISSGSSLRPGNIASASFNNRKAKK